MSGLVRAYSVMAVQPSPASPAICAAEGLDHLRQALSREDGVVHDQVADRLAVFLARKCFELFHDDLLRETPSLENSGLARTENATDSVLELGHAFRLQNAGKIGQGNDALREPALDSGARHAVHDAGVRALRDGDAARGVHGAHAGGAVFAHAGHQHANGVAAELLRDGMEKNVDGRPVAVDARLVDQDGDVAVFHAPDFHMAVARTNQRAAGRSKSPDCASFTSIAEDSSSRRANISVKPSGMCCTTTRQPGKSYGKLRENILKRVRTTSRYADGHNTRWTARHAGKRAVP